MRNLKEVTGYEELDEGYGVGDYHYKRLVDEDTDEIIVQFGDQYHDKGAEKLEGFLTGLRYAGIAFSISYADELSSY